MASFAGGSVGRVTRAQAAAAAAAASRHPPAEQAFKEGMQSVFRQWTALDLAVFHLWGGASTAERVVALVDELMAMFLGPDKVYKDVSFNYLAYLCSYFLQFHWFTRLVRRTSHYV